MRQKFYFRLLFLFVSLDEIEFFVYNGQGSEAKNFEK